MVGLLESRSSCISSEFVCSGWYVYFQNEYLNRCNGGSASDLSLNVSSFQIILKGNLFDKLKKGILHLCGVHMRGDLAAYAWEET